MSVGLEGGMGSKSPVKIFANIFISFIGAGILGLPFAFKEAGVLEGVIIMTFVGFVSVKAMLLIVDCKYRLIQKDEEDVGLRRLGSKPIVRITEGTEEEKSDLLKIDTNGSVPGTTVIQPDEPYNPPAPGQDLGYGDVGYYAMGITGRYMVDICIVVSQIGFCGAYLIFISKNLSVYVFDIQLIYWLCILLPPLACLVQLRHLSSLAISSLFAQLSNLMAFVVVFWFDLDHFSHVRIHPKKMSLDGFPFFLAVSIYCYEGAGMVLSLESSMAVEIRHKFKQYFKFTLIITTLLYISFGVCGYLSFGPETKDIITLNLPHGDGLDFAVVVKSCLCLALFFTYPVMMFPVVGIIEPKIISNPNERRWRGNLLRVVMVLLTGSVVLAIPNFANLMALVGATCCMLLAFILPGLFHMKIFKGCMSKWDYSIDVFLILLGVIGGILGTLDALHRMQEMHSETDIAPTGLPLVTTVKSSIANATSLFMSSAKDSVVEGITNGNITNT